MTAMLVRKTLVSYECCMRDVDGFTGMSNHSAVPLPTGVWTARANPIVAASATRTSKSAQQKLLCALVVVMPGTFMVIDTS
jgi:hypothetical protein